MHNRVANFNQRDKQQCVNEWRIMSGKFIYTQEIHKTDSLISVPHTWYTCFTYFVFELNGFLVTSQILFYFSKHTSQIYRSTMRNFDMRIDIIDSRKSQQFSEKQF